MIDVTVFYPATEGRTFNMEYYMATHIPMVQQVLAPALRGVRIEKGLSGGAPDAPLMFLCICHLLFDSVENFQAASGPNIEKIMADVPNYSSHAPDIQINEVML